MQRHSQMIRLFSAIAFSLLLVLLLLTVARPVFATGGIIYVDHTATAGANNGTSWTNAYTNPKNALAACGGSCEIWVAKGIYTPGISPNDVFTVTAGVTLYGGFANTETLRTQRNPWVNVTVLSGDIDNNDTKDANGVVLSTADLVGTNTQRVLYLDGVTNDITSATVIDGFTVTAANGVKRGGGLYCHAQGNGNVCSPTIANMIFSGNAASAGGAIFLFGYSLGVSSPTLTNVVFRGNTAIGDGGALYNNGNYGASNPVLTNVTFFNNTGFRGGAIFNYGDFGVSNSVVTNAILWGNSATSSAPEIGNQGGSSTVTYSIVKGGFGGAGNLDADPLFVDAANGDLDIQWGSPAINTGTNTGAPSTDIRGLSRPALLITDMGAYEFHGPGLGLAKQVTPSMDAPYSGVVTYTLTLSNSGAISDTALLTDTLPAQVSFGAWVENHGATVANNELRWNGIITESTALTFTFTATYNFGNGLPITNTAEFSGSAQTGSAQASFTLKRHTLRVATTGGEGSITSTPAGIDCGVTCSMDIEHGAVITLTATPVLTSTFTGWSGDASGTTNPIVVTIDGDKAITGTFATYQLPTTTTLQSSLNPAFVGDNIVFTAVVEENIGPFGVRVAGGATGEIDISDPTGAISLTGTLVNGSVQLNISTLEAGSYDVTAAYGGDTYHEPSVSDLMVQVVGKYSTTTSLVLAPSPNLVGEQIYFTATVAWNFGPDAIGTAMELAGAGPTGAVDFMAGNTLIGNAELVNGVAQIQSAPPITGAFYVTAHYLGDRFSLTSTSEKELLRIKRRSSAITLMSAPNPSKHGASVVFTATVEDTPVEGMAELAEEDEPTANAAPAVWNIGATAAPTPQGEVVFAENGFEIGRGQLVNGVATFADSLLPVGSHTISATYTADGNYRESISPIYHQVVQPVPTTVNDAAGTVQDETKKIWVLANDIDPAGGLKVTAVTHPAHGEVQIGPAGRYVNFKSAADASGMETFTYTATDVNGNSSTALVAVIVSSLPEGQGAPQVKTVEPSVGANLAFTSTSADVDARLSPGFYTGTLQLTDIFFIAFTPYITPTANTATPPAGFKFGNFEFELTAYFNEAPMTGVNFAIPITLTIDYDLALVGNLNPATLRLWHWDGSGWSTDGVKIVNHDIPGHKLTIALSHLSEFAFFAAELPSVAMYMPELFAGDLQAAVPSPEVNPPQEEVTPAPTPVAPSPFEMLERLFLPAMKR